MKPPLLNIQEVVRQLNLEEIGLVVLTGDLTEGGDREDYQTLKRELTGIFGEIPLYPVLGNHDNKAAFFEGWLGEKSARPYYNAANVWEGVTLLTLDNSRQGDEVGGIDESQCQWLKEALAQVTTEHCLLLTHHHLMPQQSDLPPAQYPPGFTALIQAGKINGILCGHTHSFYQGVFAGVPYFTAPSLSFVAGEVEPIAGGQRVSFVEQWGCNVYQFEKERILLSTVSAKQPQHFLGKVDFVSAP